MKLSKETIEKLQKSLDRFKEGKLPGCGFVLIRENCSDLCGKIWPELKQSTLEIDDCFCPCTAMALEQLTKTRLIRKITKVIEKGEI